MASTAQLQASLSLNSSAFAAGLQRASAAATKTSQQIGGAFKTVGAGPFKALGGVISSLVSGPMAALSAGIAGALTGKAILGGIANVYGLGASLHRLSQQTGGSVGGLAQIGAAFGEAGGDANSMGTAINRMQKQIQAASPAAAAAFQALGVSAAQLKSMTPVEAFATLGRTINGINDPTERAARSMAIFGGSGRELLKVFASSAFSQVGGELTGKAKIMAENSETFFRSSIALEKAGRVMKGLYVGLASGIGNSLLPVIEKLGKIDLVGMGQRFGKAIVGAVQFLIGAFQNPQALLGVFLNLYQASMREGVNQLVAGATYAGQRMAAVGGVLTTSFASAFGALGDLTAGLAQSFQGKLMQAPQAFIAMLGGGLDYITGELPGKLKAGLQAALNYLYAGFTYASTALSDAVANGLLSSALSFAKALTSPVETVAGMLASSLKGSGQTFANTLSQVATSGLFDSGGSGKKKSYGDYAGAFSKAAGLDQLSSSGRQLEIKGNDRMVGALEQFAKTGAALPGNLSAALAKLPGFQVKDVAGAGPYQQRAAAGVTALQNAGARATGASAPAAQGGVPAWQVGEANRIQSYSLAQSRANAIGNWGVAYMGASRGPTAAHDAGWGTGGLIGGAAATRQWNASRGLMNGGKPQSQGNSTVSAPDVVEAIGSLEEAMDGYFGD